MGLSRLTGVIERFLPIQCYASPQRNYAPKPIDQHLFIVQHYFSARWVAKVPPEPGLHWHTPTEHHFDSEICWRLMRDLNYAAARRVYGLYTGNKMYASAHFMIDREGVIRQLVPLDFQAYHAGRSSYRGHQYLNRWSIGIENIGHDKANFTDDQYQANAGLCRELMSRYRMRYEDIVGHSDIAVPHGRKADPGPTFDWEVLRHYIEAV